ncbi:MAG: hypothetical protein ACI8PT_000008 [Gammaproteobacteria bacterium]|jgi:hypothetical protein
MTPRVDVDVDVDVEENLKNAFIGEFSSDRFSVLVHGYSLFALAWALPS